MTRSSASAPTCNRYSGNMACPRRQAERGEYHARPRGSRLHPGADFEPGGSLPHYQPSNPYDKSAYAISEGQRLFDWYNCSGCHSHGGGGMGPPLIKKEWIYGG